MHEKASKKRYMDDRLLKSGSLHVAIFLMVYLYIRRYEWVDIQDSCLEKLVTHIMNVCRSTLHGRERSKGAHSFYAS